MTSFTMTAVTPAANSLSFLTQTMFDIQFSCSLKDKNSSQESSLQGRDSDQLGAELNPVPRCLHPLLHSSTDEGSMGASRTPASEVRDGD